MSDRDDDLPTEAVPSWPAPPPSRRPGADDDIWSITAPDAEPPPGGDVPPPTGPATEIMPSVPAPAPRPVEGSGAPPPPTVPPVALGGTGGPPPRRGRAWAWALVLLLVAGAAALLTVFLLGGDDDSVTEDTSTTSSTTSTMVPTSPPTTDLTPPPTAPPTEAPTTTEEPTTTITEAPTTTTEPPPAWPSGVRVVVASPDGVHVVQDGSDELVAAERVAIALPLPGGGFLVQDRSGRYDPNTGQDALPGATTIRRLDGSGAVLLAPTGEQWLRLHDVGAVDGVLMALVSISEGSNPDDTVEELVLLPVDGGSPRSIGIIGGWEAGTGRLHLGGGGVVGEAFAEATSGPLLLTVEGNQLIDPAVLGLQGSYVDCGRECPHHFATDPSGSTIGWVEAGALVVVNATNGQRLADVQLPAELLDTTVELELLQGAAVLSRRTEPFGGQLLPPVVVDLATGEHTVLAVSGIASATR